MSRTPPTPEFPSEEGEAGAREAAFPESGAAGPAGRPLTLAELKTRRERSGVQRMPVAILLENIRSIHNVGAFFRTADGAGLERVFLTGITAAPPRKEIHKVALGAEEATPWERLPDPAGAAREIRRRGYRLVAVEQTSRSRNLYETPLALPCCLVFGAEVEGVSPDLLALCEDAIEAPMRGAKESLNVSVCGGVVLYEVRRRYERLLAQTQPAMVARGILSPD